jgi:hypothetical protein
MRDTSRTVHEHSFRALDLLASLNALNDDFKYCLGNDSKYGSPK